jgi:hypothetical protein
MDVCEHLFEMQRAADALDLNTKHLVRKLLVISHKHG